MYTVVLEGGIHMSKDSGLLDQLRDAIVRLASPERIVLASRKETMDGVLLSLIHI